MIKKLLHNCIKHIHSNLVSLSESSCFYALFLEKSYGCHLLSNEKEFAVSYQNVIMSDNISDKDNEMRTN